MSVATLDGWMAARMGLAAPLTREAIAAWRLARLNETIAYARTASPFYRARRDWIDGPLAGIEDVAHLPFTTAADLAADNPPLLALSQSAVARVVTLETSGTSGPPKRLHFTPDDLEATVDFFHHGMALFARPGDRAAIAFPGRRPGGVAAGLAIALRRLGAIPAAAPSPSITPASPSATSSSPASPSTPSGRWSNIIEIGFPGRRHAPCNGFAAQPLVASGRCIKVKKRARNSRNA